MPELLYAQVLRDYRAGRAAAAGAQPTVAEQDDFCAKLSKFMRKRALAYSKTAAAVSSEAKRAKRAPRLATADWLKGVDDALAVSLDLSLQDCFPDPVAWDMEWDEATAGQWPRTFCFCNDQEQVQLCGLFASERYFGCSSFILNGPMHRLNNDFNRAGFAPGLGPVLHKKLIESNITFGPWQNGSRSEGGERVHG